MTVARTPGSPDEILQSAKHTLFVEGNDLTGIDPQTLEALLPGSIHIEPLGPSFHVRSVAEALHKYHPYYYFLIDRDHYDEKFVEDSWENFPDLNKKNLLVWRRRELENYFLIPEYLMKSSYLKVDEQGLRECILDCCQKRLFFDAANQVIIRTREILKQNWIQTFRGVDEFKTKEDAINRLKGVPELTQQKRKVSEHLGQRKIINLFEKILEQLKGDKKNLEFNTGTWLEMLRGKEVLHTVVDRCFKVKDAMNRPLQGSIKLNEVIKDLARKPLEDQPKDFAELYSMITLRVNQPKTETLKT